MPLTVQQLGAIRSSVSRYAGDVSQALVDELLNGIKKTVESLVQPATQLRDGQPVEVGFNPATARNAIADLLQENGLEGIMDSSRIDFALTTARDVAQGAGIYAKEAADADVVEAYPAWELLRVYDRDVPRGFQRGPKGLLIPVPGDDWPTRWQAAGGQLYDGRMIALKSDAVWQNLGDGAGGYTDTLGNPFPPFAFNSGFDVNNIGRVECIELGLLQEGEVAQPPEVDLEHLFAPIEEVAA